MFNLKYYRHLFRSNFRLLAVITLVMIGLLVTILSVFKPATINAIGENSAGLPFNPLGDVSSLESIIGNQYFGMMALILPMILTIILAISTISGLVDRGSMACHLSLPMTRTQVAGTSAAFIITVLLIEFGLIALTGVSVAEIVQPGELDIEIYLELTAGTLLLQYAIGGIAFIASCIWNTTSKALMIGAGIPVAFFSMNLLSKISEDLSFLKDLTIFTLFDIDKIIKGNLDVTSFVILFIMGTALYTLGLVYFRRKDLAI